MKMKNTNPFTTFIKNSGTYMFFLIVNRVAPFLLLPVLTSYLNPEDYGKISIFMIIMTITMPIIGFCSNSVLIQKYFKITSEEKVYLINDSYKIMLVICSLMLLAICIWHNLLVSLLKMPLFWIAIAVVSGLMGMVMTITTSLFQLRKQALRYGTFLAASVLCNVLLTILLVVIFKFSWRGRLTAIFISNLLFAGITLYFNYKNKDINFGLMRSSPQVRTILKLGGALIPGIIAGCAISMSDRLFLNKMIAQEALGIYTVAVMIGQIPNLAFSAILEAYSPFFFERVYKDAFQTKIRLVQSIYLLAVFSLLLAVVAYFVAPVVIHIMVNQRYFAATKIVGWLVFSYAFFAIGSMFYNCILAAEKNSIISYISYLTFISGLTGNYFLIKKYGMLGAAMGNMVSSFSFMVLMFIATLKYQCMPWFHKKVLRWSFYYD